MIDMDSVLNLPDTKELQDLFVAQVEKSGLLELQACELCIVNVWCNDKPGIAAQDAERVISGRAD